MDKKLFFEEGKKRIYDEKIFDERKKKNKKLPIPEVVENTFFVGKKEGDTNE